MSIDFTGFDADQQDDYGDFDAIPKGWYLVLITNIERPEKDGVLVGYMKIEYTVADGNFKGRKVWDMCHMWNAGAKAQKTQEIAKRQFGKICRCVNVPKPANGEALYNIPMGVKIAHEEYQGEMKEKVKDYCSEREFSAKAASNVGTATAATTEGAATPTSDKPWG